MDYSKAPMEQGRAVYTGNSANQNTASAPTPITPMQDARMGLLTATQELDRAIDRLSERLDSVCRPAYPDPPGTAGNTQAAEQPSEHRLFLASQADAVRYLTIRIEKLTGRLEL